MICKGCEILSLFLSFRWSPCTHRLDLFGALSYEMVYVALCVVPVPVD